MIAPEQMVAAVAALVPDDPVGFAMMPPSRPPINNHLPNQRQTPQY